MVYKIRNKAFNNFSDAQTPRMHINKKMQLNPDIKNHVHLQVQITRYTGMRILHNYRLISRSTKQFMMGDRFLETLMILNLRAHYFRPMQYNAPISNMFFIGRTLADLSDRHQVLFSLN